LHNSFPFIIEADAPDPDFGQVLERNTNNQRTGSYLTADLDSTQTGFPFQ